MKTRNTWIPAVWAGTAALLCLYLLPAEGQNPPAAAAPAPDAADPADDADGLVEIIYPNIPVVDILNDYEQLTGNRIIRDVSVLGASITIETSHRLTKEEAARFIEKSLLLNGFALIPSGKDTLKIVAYSGGKQPSSQGLPVFTRLEDLPESDEVVTFLLPFTYLDTEEASQTLSQIFPNNPYGAFTPLPHASAIAITENTSVIRKILEVREKIDLPPSQIESETITLERADAEEVAEALVEILGLDSAGSGGASGRGPSTLQAGNQAQQRNPQQNAAQAVRQPVVSGEGSQAVQPKIRAIPRANRVLVVARPLDMIYIKSLIAHFDEPVEERKLVRHQLNYLSVSTFLPIVSHSLMRGLGDENAQGGAQIAGGASSTQSSLGGGGIGGAGGGRSGGIGGSSSSGFGDSESSGFGNSSNLGGSRSGGGGDDQDIGPASVVIDKTLLVADNVQNTLMVSGPPEHLAIIENLLEELDQKPRQIRLSAIIAQLTLSDDVEFGFDLLRTLEAQGLNPPSTNGAGIFKSRIGESQALLDPSSLDEVGGFLPAAQGLSLYGKINPYLNAYVSALEQTNRFKVLSRPTIYTLNNRRAAIFSGERVAVPRSSQSALDSGGNNVNNIVTSNIEYEEVLLRIEVVPLINAEDNITLRISQLNDNIIGSTIIGGDEIPTIATQSLETTVIVPDGGTILLGGLISDEETKSRSGLPLFVSAPFFEKVFGSHTRDRERQELLIFIQPEIIDNEAEMNKADEKIDEKTALSDEIEAFSPPAAKVRPVSLPGNERDEKPKTGFFKRIFGGGS